MSSMACRCCGSSLPTGSVAYFPENQCKCQEPPRPSEQLGRISELKDELGRHGYVANSGLTATLLLAAALQRPVLQEGEAGVGKTDVAKSLALARNTRQIGRAHV